MYAIVAINLSMPLYIKRDEKDKPILFVSEFKIPNLTNNEDDVYLVENVGFAIVIAKYMNDKCDPLFNFKVTRMKYDTMRNLSNKEEV